MHPNSKNFMSSFRFPDEIDCSAKDARISGRYRFTTSAGRLPLSLVNSVDSKVTLIYEKMNSKGVYMVYCEGTPELLPGDIWETVVGDALSRHAHANMSAAVSGVISQEVLGNVCQDIMQVATEVSKELVGWFIIECVNDVLVPLARCVQRIDIGVSSEEKSESSTSPPNRISSWEVRTKDCPESPGWLVRGLSPSWSTLVVQPGCFEKESTLLVKCVVSPIKRPTSARSLQTVHESSDMSSISAGTESTMASPPSSPISLKIIVPFCGAVEETSDKVFRWDLAQARLGLDKIFHGEACGIESKPFGNDMYTLTLQPVTQPKKFVSVTLRRNKGTPTETIFSLSLGKAKSGTKVLKGDKFDVMFDPRAVYTETAAMAAQLAAMSITVSLM